MVSSASGLSPCLSGAREYSFGFCITQHPCWLPGGDPGSAWPFTDLHSVESPWGSPSPPSAGPILPSWAGSASSALLQGLSTEYMGVRQTLRLLQTPIHSYIGGLWPGAHPCSGTSQTYPDFCLPSSHELSMHQFLSLYWEKYPLCHLAFFPPLYLYAF